MKTVYMVVGIGLVVAAFSAAHSDEKAGASRGDSLPTLEQARRQAEILHSSTHATLQVVHHRYYRENEALQLPAASLREVFAAMEEEQGIKLRWLAVEGQVMNTDHEARDEFEREAVKALKAGDAAYERTEKGVYRRAAPITLKNNCLKCHVPDRKNTKDRTAGLIISMPVK